MKMLFHIVKLSATGSAWLVAGLLAIILFLVSMDSIGRYFLGSPIPGTLELSESVIVMIIFLTAAYCEMTSKHIRVTFILNMLPRKARRVLTGATSILSIGYFAVLCWQSWKIAWYALSIKETSWGSYPIPLYPAKFSVAIGSGIMCAYLILSLFPSLSSDGPEEPEGSREGF